MRAAWLLFREYLINLWFGYLRAVVIGAAVGIVLVGAVVPAVLYFRARADLEDHRETTVRLKACQEAAETGASLNDAWHEWLKDRTSVPARRVEQLAIRHDALLKGCRSDTSVLINGE